MACSKSHCTCKIDKKSLSTMVIFAKNNIPAVDEFTLEKFLSLLHVTGSFGSISLAQLASIMKIMKKHIPGACEPSLLVLVELLTVLQPLPDQNCPQIQHGTIKCLTQG